MTEDRQKTYLPVSVVIPCYNYGRFLMDAVKSVENSTVSIPKDQIIIVNDGSGEQETLDILDQLRKCGYKVIDQPNKGLPGARNTGFSLACTDYVLPLDADDKIAPTMIEKAFWVLRTQDKVGFVSFWLRHFGDEHWVWKPPSFSPYRLLFENIVTVTALVRKTAWKSACGYDETMLEGYEDWDFWLRLVEKKWEGYQIPEPLLLYRRHGKTMLHRSNRVHYKILARIRENHPTLYNKTAMAESRRGYIRGKRGNIIVICLRLYLRWFLIKTPLSGFSRMLSAFSHSFFKPERKKTTVHPLIKNELSLIEKTSPNPNEFTEYKCSAVDKKRKVLILLSQPIHGSMSREIINAIEQYTKDCYKIALSTGYLNEDCQEQLEGMVNELFILPNFLAPTDFVNFIGSQVRNKNINIILNIDCYEGLVISAKMKECFSGLSVAVFFTGSKASDLDLKIIQKIIPKMDFIVLYSSFSKVDAKWPDKTYIFADTLFTNIYNECDNKDSKWIAQSLLKLSD